MARHDSVASDGENSSMPMQLQLQELQRENEELRSTLEKLYGELSMRDDGLDLGGGRDSTLEKSEVSVA